MTWFKVDDGFYRHRKVRKLGKDRVAAVGLWALAGNWCADNTTDGFIPAEQVATWDPRLKLAGRLVDVVLWHESEVDGERGYQFHQWEDFQPTRESIEAEREAWRRRKAKQRSSTKSKGESHGTTQGTPQGTPRGTPPGNTTGNPDGSHADVRIPSRPVPSVPNGTEPPAASGEPPATAQTIVGEWIDRCAKRPPKQVIGQISKLVKGMLDDGQHPDDVRRGLAAWMAKNLHPSTLPSVVNEVMNHGAVGVRPSTADQAVANAQALKGRFRNHPSNQLRVTAGGEAS